MLNYNTHIVQTSLFAEHLFLPLKNEGVVSNNISNKNPLKNFDLTYPAGYVPQELCCNVILEGDRYWLTDRRKSLEALKESDLFSTLMSNCTNLN